MFICLAPSLFNSPPVPRSDGLSTKIGSMNSYRRISWFAVAALVLLRIGIGWHFFQEGAVKVREGNFTSTGFLSAAKGPFANHFHELIADHEGWIRLNPKEMKVAFEGYSEVVGDYYEFTDEQQQKADKIADAGYEEYKSVLATYEKDIKDYYAGIERVNQLETDPKRLGVASLRNQKDEIITKWKALPKAALTSINKILNKVEADLNGLATPEQSEGKFKSDFMLPEETIYSTRFVDQIIPIFDMSIGILLMIGLLTPVASIAAAIFLGSIVISQFPGYPGTQPTYFQAAEMLGCFVLATCDAGRYLGLDYIPWTFWQVIRHGWKEEA